MDLQKGWGEPKPMTFNEVKEYFDHLRYKVLNPDAPTKSCCGAVMPKHMDFCLIGKIERGEITCQP